MFRYIHQATSQKVKPTAGDEIPESPASPRAMIELRMEESPPARVGMGQHLQLAKFPQPKTAPGEADHDEATIGIERQQEACGHGCIKWWGCGGHD